MDHLNAIRVFVRVVGAGSFIRAAEALAMPRSSVTTLIKQLEAHLGATLIQRSTRRFSLTEKGEIYYGQCLQILAQLDEVEHDLRESSTQPRGRVRVDMPVALGRGFVLPRLKVFQQRYPHIELVLGMSDKPVDMIGEGVDCVIRSGYLPDSDLIAKPLGALQWIVCAATTYLEQHGTPLSLDELSGHQIINYVSASSGRAREWLFQLDDGVHAREFSGRLAVNETGAYLQCCLEGLGIIQMSEFLARPYLRSGRLREVLPELRTAATPVWLVYPKDRHLPHAVRVFIDWLGDAAL